MKLTLRLITLTLTLVLLQACAQYDNKRGVEVNWQPAVLNQLTVGESTRKEVLALMGPPSQVISMQEETVLYYLFSESKGKGFVLLVYNQFNIDTQYDRAIFFFDDNNVLTEYSATISDDS
jgi:outer membrane protein assembly factor BamE (lipoprotein component of BamABCDE complex)